MSAGFLEVLSDANGSLGVHIAAVVIATALHRTDARPVFNAALILPRAVQVLGKR